MPVAPTYPGVYIEEIPSGVRTITGVATSITAFIGRTRTGTVNKAAVINSFADFERDFGGLWSESAVGYAVRDFYMNGGSQAVIVRLYHAEDGANPKPAKSKLSIGDTAAKAIKLEAASEGRWGAHLRATVDRQVSEDVALRLGLTKDDLFNLTVWNAASAAAPERFFNLSVKDSPRRIDRIVKEESKLVVWDGTFPTAAADLPEIPTLAGNATKSDAVTAKEKEWQTARNSGAADANTKKTELDALIKARLDAVSDGVALTKAADFTPANAELDKKGLYALEQADLFNLLCIPPYADAAGVPNANVEPALVAEAAAYCERRRAMLLVDPPSGWTSKTTARTEFTDTAADKVGTRSRNAALFFPRLKQPNPLKEDRVEEFVPCGAIAGVLARTDTQRGVWKAAAGLDATLVGVPQLSVMLTDAENGELNQLGVNCLRAFPLAGRVVWGARTLRGADQLADEYKYVPIRRLALYIEESLYRGTQWVVFEPNDEPLWAQIRLNVGAFMHNLFRQGAFQGRTPRDAYFVKCDGETTTQNDRNLGIVNVVVGFAPLKPAEFVIIKIQQIAGQIEA
jgi:hypothetical protein